MSTRGTWRASAGATANICEHAWHLAEALGHEYDGVNGRHAYPHRVCAQSQVAILLWVASL